MKYLIIVVILISSLIACEDQQDDIIQLKGSWIEKSSKTDTLIFKEQETEGQFTLNRARELRNGTILPKPGSGIYDYSIKRERILLIYGLSSSRETETYSFQMSKRTGKLSVKLNNDRVEISGKALTIFKAEMNL